MTHSSARTTSTPSNTPVLKLQSHRHWMPKKKRGPLGVEACKALKLAHGAALDTWHSRKELPKPTLNQLQKHSQLVLKTASVLAFVVRDTSEDVTKPVKELTEATSTLIHVLYNWCGSDIAKNQAAVRNMIKTAATNVEQRVAEFITAAMILPLPPNLNVLVGKINQVCAQAYATPPNNIGVINTQIKIAAKQIESARQDVGNGNEHLMDERLRELHALTTRVLTHILAYLNAIISKTEQLYEKSISSSLIGQDVSQFPDDLGEAVINLSHTVDDLAGDIDLIDVMSNDDAASLVVNINQILLSVDILENVVKKAGFERKEVIDVRFAVLELREYACAADDDGH